MIGQSLGPYEIASLLGKGGMGEVYLARDSKLDRDVAIKILPAEFAQDEERVLRFQREAKLLASLEHPHVAAIYGFDTVKRESGDAIHFLVLEYVEGSSLSQRLENGSLPVDEALEFCEQIAEGLEAAHDKGIVHRDLKPANVMVRPDGSVKILDFGLARAIADESSTSASARSATITGDYTQPGTVLGTAAYMSPEQARGRRLDRRTDIWSFGCVLYECLTGKVLFGGESATESMGAILHKDPEWTLLPPDTPPTVLLLLRRCLAKDRNRRLQAMGDARVELQEVIADPTSSAVGLATASLQTRPGIRRWAIPATALVLGATVTALGMVLTTSEPSAPERLVQSYSIVLPEELSLSESFFGRSFDLSANGQVLVLQAQRGDAEKGLYVREADQSRFRLLEGSGAGGGPSVSPDGQWVVYTTEGAPRGAIEKVSIRGGPPITLFEGNRGTFGSKAWTTDGWIYFVEGSFSSNAKLRRIRENGGETETLAEIGEFGMLNGPAAFPGGTILLSPGPAFMGTTDGQIAAWQPDASELTLVTRGHSPRWSPTGHLLFVRDGTLMGAAFDPLDLEIGPAVPLIEGVASNLGMDGLYVLTESGTLYHVAGTEDPGAAQQWGPEVSLVRVTMDGTPEALPVQKGPYASAQISPDGEHILTTSRNGDDTGSLSVLDVRRDILTMLGSFPGHADSSLWSPDGNWIYYVVHANGEQVLHRVRADGSAPEERIPGAANLMPTSFTPDGTGLYVTRLLGGGIARIRLDEDFRVEGVPNASNLRNAIVSPDGAWLACLADDPRVQGQGQLYIVAADGQGGRVQVSRSGGQNAVWSPDGKKLYFEAEGNLMVVELGLPSAPGSAEQGEGGTVGVQDLEISRPAEVFELPPAVRSLSGLMPDGEGFLSTMAEGIGTGPAERRIGEIMVTLNFSKILEELVPAEAK